MKNKKAIFFTFIAVTIMAILILIYTPQADITLQKDTKAIQLRINNIDNFVNELQNSYFETVMRATTYKAILSMTFYMNSTGIFIADFDKAFFEIIVNGTINNIPIDTITGKKIMDNNTLTNWSNRIISLSKDTYNVNTTLAILNVSAWQSKPWAINSQLRFNFTIKADVAEWFNSNATLITAISIEGFHDPYMMVNTNGKYTNQIKRSSVEFNQWNISKAREHLRNGTYVYWQAPNAPSFLMRFVNAITNSSCCGIGSLINPNKVTPSDQRESYVDYLFWEHNYNPAANCTQLYNITKPPTSTGLWDEFMFFKLDFDHLIKYNITEQDSVRNC